MWFRASSNSTVSSSSSLISLLYASKKEATRTRTQHTWRMRYVRVFWPAAINGFQLLELPRAAKVSVIMMSFSEYYASLIWFLFAQNFSTRNVTHRERRNRGKQRQTGRQRDSQIKRKFYANLAYNNCYLPICQQSVRLSASPTVSWLSYFSIFISVVT